jgi:ribosomally synthesized peptide (two-chain TOMM family)
MAPVDPLKAYGEIGQWERVWIEVVARAWKDQKFRDDLLANSGANARGVINAAFQFQLPSDVNLKVVAAGPQHKSWDKDKDHPRSLTELTLILPAPPASPGDHAVALAHYVASGRSMPFTCCC